MKRLVSALCRAYSSLVGNHLVINNKISEWIRVVADTNGRDKELPNRGAGSFDPFFFFFFFLTAKLGAMPDTHTHAHTHTRSQTDTNTISHCHSDMHTHIHTHILVHDSG